MNWAFTAAFAALTLVMPALGEALVCANAINAMSRNPELQGKLRTTMIMACALVETTGIYALLIAILCIFVAK